MFIKPGLDREEHQFTEKLKIDLELKTRNTQILINQEDNWRAESMRVM